MTALFTIRYGTRKSDCARRRPYTAEELRAGMFVIDSDQRLGLHEVQVRVVADAVPLDVYDTTNVVVDYDVVGTSITGRFTSPRLATVWVVGGDGRW